MTQQTRPRPKPVPRPTAGRLRLRPTARGRGFVVGVVDATGPDTTGFAPRDRVAWPDAGGELPELLIRDQQDVLGVPDWITDEQVVSYLGPGLIARALVRTRPFARGEGVQVIATDPLVREMAAAWARSLGARIVERDPDVALRVEPAPRRRTATSSHGRLAQAAVEVFQAIRRGVFDGVPPLGSERSPKLAA